MTIQADQDKFVNLATEHVLAVRNRKRVEITFIKSIERFDPEEFYIKTANGLLIVKGEELKIIHLDVEQGLLTIEGLIKILQYDEDMRNYRNDYWINCLVSEYSNY